MLKKISKLIALLLIVSSVALQAGTSAAAVFANDIGQMVTTKATSSAPSVEAKYAILIDSTTGTVLYDKESDLRAYPASTTKIMTLLLALESGIGLTTPVTISPAAASQEGSSAGLKAGDIITFGDLLYAMMLPSGNDAAWALAETVGNGSEPAFIQKMNDKAKELGMTNTHYVTPNGLQDVNHYTTCKDMAKLALVAMKNSTFTEVVSTKSKSFAVTGPSPRTITKSNTNKLITEHYEGATGIKTGTTADAGATLVASASRSNLNLIGVILCDNAPARFVDMKKLFDYGFNNYETLNLAEVIGDPQPIPVNNFALDDPENGSLKIRLRDTAACYYTCTKQKASIIRSQLPPFSVDTVKKVSAPVKLGQSIGTIVYKYGDEVILSSPAVALRDVAARIVTPPDIAVLDLANARILRYWQYGIGFAVVVVLVLFSVFVAVRSRKRYRYRLRKRNKYIYTRR